MCVGWLAATTSSAYTQYQAKRKREAAVLEGAEAKAKRAEATALAHEDLTFAAQRRLWLRALSAFFRNSAELQHVGPIVWRFLDDQPRLVRIAECSVQAPDSFAIADIALRSSSGDAAFGKVAGDVLTFVAGHDGSEAGGVISAVENEVVVESTVAGKSGGQGAAPQCPELRLLGHTAPVKCVAEAGEWRATGSLDTTVRLWRGAQLVRTYASYEWSEWIGTLNLGHITTVSAVCLTEDGDAASGDDFGNVCIWKEDGSCRMLAPPCQGGILALAVVPGAGLGEHCGEARRLLAGSSYGALCLLDWQSAAILLATDVRTLKAGGSVLAIAVADRGRGRQASGLDEPPPPPRHALVLCSRGLLRVHFEKETLEVEELAVFPWRHAADGAAFSSGSHFAVAWRGAEVAVIDAQTGGLRQTLSLATRQASSPPPSSPPSSGAGAGVGAGGDRRIGLATLLLS